MSCDPHVSGNRGQEVLLLGSARAPQITIRDIPKVPHVRLGRSLAALEGTSTLGTLLSPHPQKVQQFGQVLITAPERRSGLGHYLLAKRPEEHRDTAQGRPMATATPGNPRARLTEGCWVLGNGGHRLAHTSLCDHQLWKPGSGPESSSDSYR